MHVSELDPLEQLCSAVYGVILKRAHKEQLYILRGYTLITFLVISARCAKKKIIWKNAHHVLGSCVNMHVEY